MIPHFVPFDRNSEYPYGKLNKEARSFSAIEENHPFAQKIGAMIANFALVEREMPFVLARLSGMSTDHAFTTLGVFRAFSNRIDLFSELTKVVKADTPEFEIARHFKGQFTLANKIRNKYAHASYAGRDDPILLTPFSGDFVRPVASIKVTLEDMEAELDKIRIVACECWAFGREKRLPEGLHVRLSRKYPSANWG
ncbi:MAG: hypothetical protein ACJLS3_13935 [Erythrobacter sp.]